MQLFPQYWNQEHLCSLYLTFKRSYNLTENSQKYIFQHQQHAQVHSEK